MKDAPVLLRSCYGNEYKIGGEQMNDVKAKNATDLRLFAGNTFLSTTDGLVLYPKFFEVIHKKLPQPSKHELVYVV